MISVRIRHEFPAGRESAGFRLDVDFQANAGVTVVYGPSGAGKTLTLESIAGFARPQEGRIVLADQILFDSQSGLCQAPQKRRCGYVFQNYALFPHMTLRQNLAFAGAHLPSLDRRRRVNEMLEHFRLAEFAGRRPAQLSGGQKQRASVARALLAEPRILLLDEPSRGLDAPLRQDLYAALEQVRREFHTPMLLVTHDLEECLALGDWMIVIDGGRVVQTGTPEQILERPANVDVARLLGIFNVFPAEILALDPAQKTSRLRVYDHELQGPYFPGQFKGDRVWLGARHNALRVREAATRAGLNEMALRLERMVDLPHGWRLEFEAGIQVVSAVAVDPEKSLVVEFPPARLVALPKGK
jgi:molybdate transport system ATP-binding protein